MKCLKAQLQPLKTWKHDANPGIRFEHSSTGGLTVGVGVGVWTGVFVEGVGVVGAGGLLVMAGVVAGVDVGTGAVVTCEPFGSHLKVITFSASVESKVIETPTSGKQQFWHNQTPLAAVLPDACCHALTQGAARQELCKHAFKHVVGIG